MVQTKTKSESNGISGNVVHGSPSAKERQEPMNLDVLFLIAEYAHPRDLLSLASTCKYFQEPLMDQSSTLVWRTARSKFEGLPDCPADLTEREYANLAFCARCHGCGQYSDTVFWEMRRRYCPDCRVERLCCLSVCDEIIQKKYVLGMGGIGIETPFWVDREQMEAFIDEYKRCSDKKQMLSYRQEQLAPIRRHARQCENWQRADQKRLREERDRSIFEHLKQLGYEPDVEFSGRDVIRESRKSLFNISKPLTDKEWDRIWPKWMEKMNNFRLLRLVRTVYRSRRRSLVDAYNNYVHHPSPDTPSFELLPHAADVARFPPFRDIIRAPEEISVSDRLFEPAFAQLPEFVDEWRKKLDAEVAELVQIPPLLSLNDTSGQVTTSSSPTGSESSRAPTDKLRLACALFRRGSKGTFTHPNVFSTSMLHYEYPSIDDEDDTERTGSIWDRFSIEYAEAAPYVVHACGLDPNVATVEDMERRNARLQCLSCQDWCYSWREAVRSLISAWGDPFCMARWRPIDDDSEEMQKIRAAELADNRDASLRTSRCLLCRPRVGDELLHETTLCHLVHDHDIKWEDTKRGVHYMLVAVREHCSVRRGRGGEEQVKFEVDRYHIYW